MTAETDVPVWSGVTITHQDSTTEQGSLNKVFYSGDWSSNSANAWGANGAAFEITFKGTGINLYGITNPANGSADIYLNGEWVGEANYLNNSELTKMVWQIENLEDRQHTLKVVAKERYTSFSKAEITTAVPPFAVKKRGPSEIVKLSDEAEIGAEENTVYAFRKNASWGSNDTNAWAHFDDDPYLFIHFTGTGIDYLAGKEEQTLYKFELDGKNVGNFGVDPRTGIRYTTRDLEEGPHTLKVSLGDNERKETFMDYRGVHIYSTPQAGEPTSTMIFSFEGSGFHLFGATPDAVIDVVIDGQLVAENERITSKGDRQTSYHISGLENKKHLAKIEVKGGTFVVDGLDVITGTTEVKEK